MITNLKLDKVHYVPKQLEPGILYYSKEFEIAAHLCACGCGNKIVTPLGPTDWVLTLHKGKPSLYPSIGNWQIPCRSHYWVKDGIIRWSYQWTEQQILAGRKNEEVRKKNYYKNFDRNEKNMSIFNRVVNWLFQKKKENKY
jgi:hypothetical protein